MRSEDQSLRETNVSLTSKWIQDQVSEGSLPPIGLKKIKPNDLWSEIRARMEESDSDRIKSIVNYERTNHVT